MTDVLASTTCFADVLQLHGRRGWLTPPLVRIAPGTATVAGRALTVQLRADDDGPGVGEVHRLADADGAVVVGSAVAERVLDDVAAYAACEAEVEAALARGERLVDAYRHKRAGVAAIRARGAL